MNSNFGSVSLNISELKFMLKNIKRNNPWHVRIRNGLSVPKLQIRFLRIIASKKTMLHNAIDNLFISRLCYIFNLLKWKSSCSSSLYGVNNWIYTGSELLFYVLIWIFVHFRPFFGEFRDVHFLKEKNKWFEKIQVWKINRAYGNSIVNLLEYTTTFRLYTKRNIQKS